MALSRKGKIFIGIGLLAVLSVVVVAGIYASRSDAAEVQVVATEKRAELRSTVTAPGEIRPIQFINLTSEVQGRIEEIYVKEGDVVEKGQQLVRLDPNQLQSSTDAQLAAFEAARDDVQSSRTQVIAAQNQLSQAQQGLNAAQASVNTAVEAVNQAKQGQATAQIELNAAQRELKRIEELLEAGAESRQNYDTAKDRVETARANLASRRIAVTEAEARVKEARARADQQAVSVKDARRGVQTAQYSSSASESRADQQAAVLRGQRNQRDKTLQVAPISGVIADIPSKVGTFATANLSSTPLLTIADMSTINVEVKVDETEIDKVAVGQPAVVKVDAFGDEEIVGKVTQKTPLAVGKSQTSGGLSTNINVQEAKEFRVVIELQDVRDEIRNGLRPGMSATAEITTDVKKDVVSVPIQAVIEKKKEDTEEGEGEGETEEKDSKDEEETVKGVFVMDGNKVAFREVTTGITGESDIEVTSGLEEGQEVITGPSRVLNTLKEGDPVKRQEREEGEGNGS
ncbi:MAG: HlyD family efflux transporter periplasmic adaptor subunit [Acidobacteria bacterium]|nr:MAG: HlyD family efflux transporter periplasmic adaptor subunit [Acidobacteriota bacterium]REK01368.1 MAG: HlyD family efflux transporter periplasmic adaptor subunit [Acidobacteriota bacterium]REK14324.1 MAG: HlyD family efflux transporter periplasmic adaptor subunit [Acidobacteriota bacterium]REK45039.1 MAG: HlyD family efflux transporter periplasmic adaptor subunit [Acidobacteriota bacterium]